MGERRLEAALRPFGLAQPVPQRGAVGAAPQRLAEQLSRFACAAAQAQP
jgi:hypothetical protein